MARVEDEERGVGVARIAAVAHHEIATAAVHDDGVETQETAVAAVPNDALGDGAVVGREIAIDDLHLRDKPLRVDGQVGFAVVVVNGIIARHAGALRDGVAGHDEQQRRAERDGYETYEWIRRKHVISWTCMRKSPRAR
jgi:hypothetical protein